MEIVGIIPARFASTRLPGKPLLSDTGRPLIQHVVEAARRPTRLDRIIVATDDARIADAVAGLRRRGRHDPRRPPERHRPRRRGRRAACPRPRSIVNLQGDEPEVSGEALDLVVALLEDDPEAPMATLATPIRDEAVYRDPSCVKVVALGAGPGPLLLPEPDPPPPRRPARPRGRPARRAAPPGPLRLPPRLPAQARPSCPPRPWRRPRSSNSSASSRPATRSPSGSSTSRASASTRPRTTGGSSSAGRPRDRLSGRGRASRAV